MKYLKLIALISGMVFLGSCNQQKTYDPSKAEDIFNVSYGNHSQQNMDIYLPANRTSQTRVVILVHGGGWSAGSKEDFNYAVPFFKTYLPQYAVVNINYRLGTVADPGFPKQIQDIQSVIDFLEENKEEYTISSDLALFGGSAGGHLSLLYAYDFDPADKVKAVCSLVGPTDLTDPSYTQNPAYDYAALSLVGNYTYVQNPALYIEVSPAQHVTPAAPKTLMFYGGADVLVPATQGPVLKTKLDDVGVYNELYLYPNEGHGGWSAPSSLDMQIKLVNFFNNHF